MSTELHPLETALDQLPMRFDFETVEARRLFMFLVFYPTLRADSDYRSEVDDTYELRHNPVNHHVTLYEDGSLCYSSYTDEREAEEFVQFLRDLVDDLQELPPLLDGHNGPVTLTEEHLRPVASN